MNKAIVLLVALMLSGCGFRESDVAPRFTLFETSTGSVILLNTHTGETKELKGSAPSKSDSAERTQLRIGDIFSTETGEVMRYVGKGKLEPRPPISSFFKK